MRTVLPIALIAATLSPLAAQVPESTALAPLSVDRQKGFDSIDAALCREWLTYLSSDELRGRETGKPGYKKAAEFVAAHFEEIGLKPVGDDGTYFQQVPFASVGPDAKASYLAVVAADGTEILRVKPGAGLGGRISEKSDKEFGITELVVESADEVKAAEVEGKIVLFTDKSGRRSWRTLYTLAQRSPGAILQVDDEAAAAPATRRISYQGGGNRARRGRARMPNTYAISSQTAEQIRAAMKANGDDLVIKVHIEIVKDPVFAANVVGLLEGRDPKLAHEIVGIGSHLDHIGARGEVINNGADDDGSGTTGVLAVSRAFATNGKRPRRSILFMCFSGEEKGLIGSRYYSNNPLFPNENMIAELQMDMIGRREERINRETQEVVEAASENINTLHLVGTQKLSEDLHQVCLALNSAHIGFEFEYDEESVFGRSDHANFAKKDIPIAFFFTGFHPQYHKPDDTVDRIDFPKLVRVAQLVYSIGFEIAERDQRVVRDRTWAELRRR